MTATDTPTTPRGAAEASRDWLANPVDAELLIGGLPVHATKAARWWALFVMAKNHDDLPVDIQAKLLGAYSPLPHPTRGYQWTQLCEQMDDLTGLREVEGYADKWREEGEVIPDPEAMRDLIIVERDATLRILTEGTTA